jgi:hypothetical protein
MQLFFFDVFICVDGTYPTYISRKHNMILQ